ncbi:MAG TPA: alpha/beta fold hydrolase [Thermoanaerobaculia bacterium]|jgi:pimeloyl-ACP methyl ester carboxylesterase
MTTRIRRLVLAVLSLVACDAAIAAEEAVAGKVVLEAYSFRAFDATEVPAELGKLWVRENRGGTSKRLIQVAFVRLKSTAERPGSPIVFLAGGPGVPGIGMGRVPVYFRLFQQLRSVADVVLLDQRGIGMSSPALDCPATPVPGDVFASSAKWLEVLTRKSRSCAADWRAKGVDVAAYTNDASADDLDDLRQALGAERISLIGHSYGTLLAQAAVRRHGSHVERVVFAGTEGADELVALPGVWDGLIRKLGYFASEDASVNQLVPDLEALFRRVLEKLERKPLTLAITQPDTKATVDVVVGPIGLQWLLRNGMSDARTYARLPALLYTIDRGDLSLLTRAIAPLHRAMQGRSPMANAVDCSIGWSAARVAAAARETPGALFSNVNLQRTAELCSAVGLKPHDPSLQPRLFSRVPALFVSGTLDANTPPFQAEAVRWGFPDSTHLIVENGGHETLPSADVQAVIVDFFKGVNVRGRTVAFERPDFVTVEEAKGALR